MKNKNDIAVRFNDTTYKKLKEFSTMNYISVSEVFRVLVEKSKIKLDNARDKFTVSSNAYKDKNTNKNRVMFYLNKELIQKINKMKLENNASYSEIARCLIEGADFNKYKFKTLSEVYKNTKYKYKKNFSIHVGLDASTHKKLKKFVVTNYTTFTEVIRVLIEKSEIKINVRNISKVLSDGARTGKTKKDIILVYLDKELQDKINKMKVENNAPHSEIVSYLINNTDLSKMEFKTKDENFRIARQKTIEQKRNAKQPPRV